MSTIIGTIHLSPIHQRSRPIIRATGPLFNPHVREHLAHSAARYHRGTKVPKAIVLASAIAIFEYNEPTPL
ncbi:hypothetical protein A8H39_10855 [Paraburkholderia fungorum]|jgi:hypothetical protein|uniref:hypothetical protein n=1 Tax=Paraburkholderia fungorum TaxID=134537 RepID=UPI0004854A10|nr:hypothetical protein [Paraburkholderia fungorum]MBB5543340.1 hypothetical protein [Paraburkholderia fungorum]PNE56302.1 hypothetical protein A8H39_10855 [Paraburkholderia fungorum]